MPDLLSKLNVLVRSSLTSFMGSAADEAKSLPGELFGRLGQNIDSEVTALRRRVEQAISEEEAMQAEITRLAAQSEQLSAQADHALTRNNDAEARYALEQQRRIDQRLAMQRSELETHKRATADLMQHVNVLDSVLSDKRREAQAVTPTEGPSLSDMLRDAREQTSVNPTSSNVDVPDQEVAIPIRINRTQDAPGTGVPGATAPAALPSAPPKNLPPDDEEADLARRRSRLTKPE
ncbi:MAG TPA: PspA/IM30 family protein [Aggregatilineales bacterium]|nr:PspA/IM30 family protein [Aggregatilineales bacterium]